MKRSILSLLFAALPSLALAQSAPANLSAMSVYGRLGIPGDTGPGQSIPFTSLANQLINGGLVKSVPAGLSSATISSGGSGCSANSTFNVLTTGGIPGDGGSQATISVTTNGSGVVTAVNSVVNSGSWVLVPPTPNIVTGGTCFVAPKLNLVFSGANAGDAVIIGSNQGIILDAGAPPVLTTTTIGTTSPLVGGGALSSNLTLSLGTQNANTVLAGPVSGSPVAPSFRGIVATDLPVATSSAQGIVQTDGSTITNSSGTISCTTATSSLIGCAKPDGTTITASAGVLTAIGSSATTVDARNSSGATTINNGNAGYALTQGASGTFMANNQLYSTAGGLINKFRNPSMDVVQRGTSSMATSSGGAYTADGWIVAQAGAQFTCSQDTGNNGALHSLKCAGGTSNTDTKFNQRIESSIAAPMAGATITVQFQFKQTSGSTITPKISSCYASATDNFTTCTGDLSATSLSSCATATWCTEAYTLSASSNASNGYQITLDCNTALTAAEACWITAADVRVTPGVATGVNSNPPLPELRPIFAEMSFNQRYFTTTYGNGTAPGTATRLGMIIATEYISSNLIVESPTFPVQMRAVPASISYYDGAGNASKMSTTSVASFTVSWTDNVALSSGSIFLISNTGFSSNMAGATAATIVAIHYTVSVEL